MLQNACVSLCLGDFLARRRSADTLAMKQWRFNGNGAAGVTVESIDDPVIKKRRLCLKGEIVERSDDKYVFVACCIDIL